MGGQKGKHIGSIDIQSGALHFDGDALVGGEFTILTAHATH